MEHQIQTAYNRKNRFGEAVQMLREEVTDQRVSLCSQIRDFVAECRKAQTAYKNLEGYLSRRTVKRNELETLKNYIHLTVSSVDSEPFDSSKESGMLKKILDATERCSLGDEIHLFVVWVYFFDYSQRSMKSTPVFKVYRNCNGNQALYIDMNLREYDSWDEFIDKGSFPDSFGCFPRQGDYVFKKNCGTEKLDLEFICIASLERERRICRNSGNYTSISPYSQKTIIPTIKTCLQNGVRVCQAVEVFSRYFEEPYANSLSLGLTIAAILMKGVLFAIECYEKAKEPEEVISEMKNGALMLVNNSEAIPENLTQNLRSFFAGNLNDNVEVRTPDASVSFWVSFREMLRHPKENFWEIINLVFRIVAKYGRAFLDCFRLVSSIYTHPKLGLSLLLDSIDKHCESEIPDSRGTNYLEHIETNPVRNEIFGLIGQRMLRSQSLSAVKDNSVETIPPRVDISNCEVYLLNQTSLPKCQAFLAKLFGSKFTLLERSFWHEIHLKESSERLVGAIFFLEPAFAVVMLRGRKQDDGDPCAVRHNQLT